MLVSRGEESARSEAGSADVNLSSAERIASAAGGGLLVLAGLVRGGLTGAGRGFLGAELLRRGLSGRSYLYGSLGVSTADGRLRVETPDVESDPALAVRRSVTILRSREDLYRLWRDLEGLPRFLDRIERVEVLDERRSRWTARGPAGARIVWDAEITEDREAERIAWRTLGTADFAHRGEIRFRDAPADRGTEVELLLDYAPPGGPLGRMVAGVLDRPPGGRPVRILSEFLGASPAARVATALRRLKQMAETGEIPVTDGEPSGRKPDRRRNEPLRKEDDPWRLQAERRRWRRRSREATRARPAETPAYEAAFAEETSAHEGPEGPSAHGGEEGGEPGDRP